MLYIYNQTILVEIKQLQNDEYLIGNIKYDNVPSYIIDGAFEFANWNRALRFKTINSYDNQIVNQGYFMINFEVYFDYSSNKIVYITKDQFRQKIINQKFFDETFVQDVFNFRNRNKLNYLPKNLDQDFFDKNNVQVIEIYNVDFNQTFINQNFDLKKTKYKVLFKLGNEFKVEKTNHGQMIYHLNYQNDLISLIDYKTNLIYFQGSFLWGNHQFNLDLVYENKKLSSELMNLLIDYLKNNLEPQYFNWHLFNLTKDEIYLIDEVEKLVTKYNYQELFLYFDQIFANLKINYYSSLFKCQKIKDLLFKSVKNQVDITELLILIKRYSVISKTDVKNSLESLKN